MTFDQTDEIKRLATSIARERDLERFNKLAFEMFKLLNGNARKRENRNDEAETAEP